MYKLKNFEKVSILADLTIIILFFDYWKGTNKTKAIGIKKKKIQEEFEHTM